MKRCPNCKSSRTDVVDVEQVQYTGTTALVVTLEGVHCRACGETSERSFRPVGVSEDRRLHYRRLTAA
jgi:hypothetical protein